MHQAFIVFLNRSCRTFVAATVVLLACVAAVAQAPAAGATTGKFRVVFDPSLQPEKYTGRVYVALAANERPGPKAVITDWFSKSQVLSLDVQDVATGGSVEVGAGALGFPKDYAAAESREWFAQAVARKSLDSPFAGKGEGDLYSEPVKVQFKPGADGVVELRLSKVMKAKPFKETERVKLFEMESPLLTAFHGRPVKIRAGVAIPKDWKDDASVVHPTVYFVGGFGGDHTDAFGMSRMTADKPGVGNVLLIVPDATCFRGHSVFADSANNGPWGRALTEELIPAVEKRFHGARTPDQRYVTGISSGGWSSLWLQVAYPDVFAGCWSHCPDPVDFRDFQRIDLYTPGTNMYRDAKGARRPLARQGDEVMLWYDDFVRQETVAGPGGQIHSFEAVFSPRENGVPRPLFDRASGAIDPVTAKAWEAYDIRLVLERNWATLGPKLKGKLHIYAGGNDTFYLEGAAKLLKESLGKLGSDAEVQIIEGMPHTIYGEGVNAMFETIARRASISLSSPPGSGPPGKGP